MCVFMHFYCYTLQNQFKNKLSSTKFCQVPLFVNCDIDVLSAKQAMDSSMDGDSDVMWSQI